MNAIQLKYVTIFFDKVLWIDWKYDNKNALEGCILHFIGMDMMGTQQGMPNEMYLDANTGMVELRQFLDTVCRFQGIAVKES